MIALANTQCYDLPYKQNHKSGQVEPLAWHGEPGHISVASYETPHGLLGLPEISVTVGL